MNASAAAYLIIAAWRYCVICAWRSPLRRYREGRHVPYGKAVINIFSRR